MNPLSSPRYAVIKEEKKAEVHIHAGGSFPAPWLEKIAEGDAKRDLQDFILRLKQGMPYEEVIKGFPLISKIVNTNAKIEKGVYKLCKSLEADGVVLCELRSGLKSLQKESEEAYLLALLRGIERAKSDKFKATLVLSIQRASTTAEVLKTVDLARRYQARGVVGIDISGLSTAGDIRPLIPLLKEAKEAGLKITAHIGESYDEKDQMTILREVMPDRIGHGVCLFKEAAAWIREHKIPIEVCPTSARLCKMHNNDEVHPWILEHLQTGHPIIICTDDPTIFGASLTDEYYSLLAHMKLEQIIEIAKKSLAFAF